MVRRRPAPSTAATSSAAAIGTQSFHLYPKRAGLSPFARASVRAFSSGGGPLAAASRRALWVPQMILS